MNRLLLIPALLLGTAACTTHTPGPLSEDKPIPVETTVPDSRPPAPSSQAVATGTKGDVDGPLPSAESDRSRVVPPRNDRQAPVAMTVRHKAPERVPSPDATPTRPPVAPRVLDLAAQLEKFTIEERIEWLTKEMEKRGVGNVLDRVQ
jgi:hypothetical protein